MAESRTAVFSECLKYRYSLTIVWDNSLPLCQFIGLNPSTADEMKDDPTIRRCKGFARSWGYGGIIMTNLFAYRATDPNEMKRQGDPIGGYNDPFLIESAVKSRGIICAWGNHGSFRLRSQNVRRLLTDFPLKCFRQTKANEPEHPLYMPSNQPLQKYS